MKKLLWATVIGAIAYCLYRTFAAGGSEDSIWAEYAEDLD
jgi:hypothetical protein